MHSKLLTLQGITIVSAIILLLGVPSLPEAVESVLELGTFVGFTILGIAFFLFEQKRNALVLLTVGLIHNPLWLLANRNTPAVLDVILAVCVFLLALGMDLADWDADVAPDS